MAVILRLLLFERYWPSNELPFGCSYVCANFGENRSRNATVRVPTDVQIHWQTQTDLIVCPVQAICCSYGTDNKYMYEARVTGIVLLVYWRLETDSAVIGWVGGRAPRVTPFRGWHPNESLKFFAGEFRKNTGQTMSWQAERG